MREIKIFENEEFGQIRTTIIDNEPWFVGKDVAEILGYGAGKSLANAVAAHVDAEDKGVTEIMTPGGKQKMITINESGLYSLILSSKMPKAKEFKQWVTSEVLPTIRKTGGYITPQRLENIFTNPDKLSVFLNQMLVINEENKRLRTDIESSKPKVEYFDRLIDKNLLVNFRTTSKELGIGQNEFIDYLIKKKYLYRDSRNVFQPYMKYVKEGLFEIKEYYRNGYAGTQTLLTAKGRKFFLKLKDKILNELENDYLDYQ